MVQLDYPTDGTVISAGDHIDRVSFMLSNQISLFLDGVTSTNQENLKLDLFGSDTMTGTNMQYNSGTDLYEYKQVDDEIDDSDLTDHWDKTENPNDIENTATVVEDASKIRITVNSGSIGVFGTNPNASVISTGGVGTAIDYYNSNADVYIKSRIAVSHTTGSGGNFSSSFGISDGATTVWLKTWTTAENSSTTDDSVWEIFINASANTVDIYDDGVVDTADIDISTVNLGNYYFIMTTSSTINDNVANSSTFDIHYLYSIGVGYASGILEQTTADTIVSSDKVITKTAETLTDGTLQTIEVSVDNGVGYTSLTKSTLGKITTAGTQLKHKFTFTAPTSISVSGNKVFTSITGFGSYYSV